MTLPMTQLYLSSYGVIYKRTPRKTNENIDTIFIVFLTPKQYEYHTWPWKYKGDTYMLRIMVSENWHFFV